MPNAALGVLFGLCAVAMLGRAWSLWCRGSFRQRVTGRRLSRQDEPVQFWSEVLSNAGCGLALAVAAIHWFAQWAR
ncbi:hypothetical protein [Ralstonia sp. 24A2]|uniref:hypothetical protein n=1 Tax=Ralstonia sp. 24A2 TaxID=3447364 RepID=UPI003F696D72